MWLMLISCSCVLGFSLAIATGPGGSGSGTPPRGPRDCGDVYRAGKKVEGYYAVFANQSNPDNADLIFCSVKDGMLPRNSSVPRTSPKNCQDLKDGGMIDNGVNVIYPYAAHPESPVIVYCDQTTLDGGWTVFQRRDDYDSQLDFYNSFDEYAQGFGNVGTEFWLGNDILHELTQESVSELYVDLTSFAGVNNYALYKSFYVGPRAPVLHDTRSYRLAVSHYTGTASDALTHNSGMGFSTYNDDNDNRDDLNCATVKKGGWWYNSCTYANPNGIYYDDGRSDESSAYWYDYGNKGHYDSLQRIILMTRPLKQQ